MRLSTFGGLTIANDGADDATAARPRSLALLSLLATAGSRGMSRDQVLAVLWPESPQDRGRHALSQALYTARLDLGVDVIHGGNVLRLDADRISSDVGDFQQALRAKHWAEAATLYTGPFLDGFYLGDAPEFERWVETTRIQLAADGARAISALAVELTSAGETEEAARQWVRLGGGE